VGGCSVLLSLLTLCCVCCCLCCCLANSEAAALLKDHPKQFQSACRLCVNKSLEEIALVVDWVHPRVVVAERMQKQLALQRALGMADSKDDGEESDPDDYVYSDEDEEGEGEDEEGDSQMSERE
jgi:hypothetical protein